MTTMPKFKTDAPTTTTDVARIGDRTVRVFGVLICPCCLVRLHATAMRDIGDDEYALICPRCHSDVLSITAH